jgi:ferrous iron transport protein B
MADRMEYKGITLDIPYEKPLKQKLLISSRKGTGIDELKDLIVITFLQNLP